MKTEKNKNINKTCNTTYIYLNDTGLILETIIFRNII